jgi:hypothetical protein
LDEDSDSVRSEPAGIHEQPVPPIGRQMGPVDLMFLVVAGQAPSAHTTTTGRVDKKVACRSR